jgi:tetratricopeptide (TPR) repeat protein
MRAPLSFNNLNMNQKFFRPLALLLFITATGFIVVKYQKQHPSKNGVNYHLRERKEGLMQGSEWPAIKTEYANLVKLANSNTADIKSSLALSSLFIQEGRVTGDYQYYDAAAMKYINQVLEKEPANFEALTMKALVEMSQHHFYNAKRTAEKARKINPYNAFVYGLLVDANVETGDYEQAVMYADSMVSIRPDLKSYSRISYLREIHGDMTGAINAMEMAVNAGAPGQENTEWCRIQLGKLYEQLGDMAAAEKQYSVSLSYRSNYPHALFGLSRIAASRQQWEQAMKLIKQASELSSEYSIKSYTAKLYRMAGDTTTADKLLNEILDEMKSISEKAANDESIGHYSDAEIAEACFESGDFKEGLKYAKAEYERRPKNLDANATIAWAYYKTGDKENAIRHIKVAMSKGSKNPVLVERSRLIMDYK